MTKISKPLVFFGTESFSLPSLQALIDAKFDIRAVITKPDTRRGRGYKLTAPSIKILAEKYKLPVWQPNDLHEIENDIKAINNVAGVLVAYGKIIPDDFLELFAPGIINIHPSLLPRYRGPSPIEAAILNGDSTTGVSLIKLTKAMDAGPIYNQTQLKLTGSERRPDLYNTLAKLSAQILIASLLSILNGDSQPTTQNDSEASYCQMLTKANGKLDVIKQDATRCERHVRAYLDFPRSQLEILGHNCIIIQAHVVKAASQAPLVVKCSNNTYLSVDKLIAPSGKLLGAQDFLRGYSKPGR